MLAWPAENGDRMKQTNSPQSLVLKGQVIEVYQKAGKPVTRVSVDSFYLDVPSSLLPDAHLKDSVVIEGELSIKNIRNDFMVGLSRTES